jgi:hypothetical protein
MDKPLTTCKALAAGAAVVTAVTIGADEGKPTNNPPDLGRAHLRVARPTDNWVAVVKFYRDGLGFEVLYEFKDHDGFDARWEGGGVSLEVHQQSWAQSQPRPDRGQFVGLLHAQ